MKKSRLQNFMVIPRWPMGIWGRAKSVFEIVLDGTIRKTGSVMLYMTNIGFRTRREKKPIFDISNRLGGAIPFDTERTTLSITLSETVVWLKNCAKNVARKPKRTT